MIPKLLLIFIYCGVIYSASVLTSKKDDLNNANFLNKPVEKPHIQGGNGEIHKISDAKPISSSPHNDAKLDHLLKEIYDKFVTVSEDTSVTGQNGVRIGEDGKAHKTSKTIPNASKKEILDPHIGVDGKARPVDARIPVKHNDETGLYDILNSIRTLVDKLSKKEKLEKKEFSFESVKDDEKSDTEKTNEVSKKEKSDTMSDKDFKLFKDKFLDTFIQKDNDKKQKLIGFGKDHHNSDSGPPGLIGSGKDNYPGLIGSGKDASPGLIGSGKDHSTKSDTSKKSELRSRLNQLYDELRKETSERIDEEKERNKRERLELVKKDLVGLLNGLQSREKFVYHDGRFDVEESDSGFISKIKENQKRSKLAVVQSLVKQLKELEEVKKREEIQRKEEEERKSSAKRMENIFMDAFKRELEKRRITEQKKKEAEEEEEEEKKRKEMELKKRNENNNKKEDNEGRNMLLKIMGELEKRITNEKSKVKADEKEISDLQQKKKKSTSSIEKELDNILSDLSSDMKKSAKENSSNDLNSIDKAFEGFNINENKIQKVSRP